MALPSQSARALGFGSSATTFRRRRRRFNPALLTLVTVVVGLVVAAVWGGLALFSGPGHAEAAGPKGDPPAGWSIVPQGADPAREYTPADQPAQKPTEKVEPAVKPQPKVDSPGPVETTPRRREDPPEATDEVARLLAAARARFEAGDLIEARVHLNRALRHAQATEPQRAAIRKDMAHINDELVFSPKVAKGDPFTELYTIQPNDSLVKIASRQGLAIDHRFIARINRMSNPNQIRLGDKLKLVRGPFHAIVSKSAYRLDLYVGDPSDPEDPQRWMFIRSFDVGLGEGNSTPVGDFIVKADSKLINPHWVNPRTGQAFAADDPLNPIGEHWLGLSGLGDAAAVSGYGIHGTIDPASIGRMQSMGCIRLRPDDVAIIYELLEERVSKVSIRP